MKNKYQIKNSTAEFLIFTGQNKDASIEVMVVDENIWMTQELISELFGKSRSTISEHIYNILSEELKEEAVCRKFRRTASDNKNYNTKFYSLEMIIAIGFRTNSKRAIQFRNWAGNVLKFYSIRGYVLDKERMKNGSLLNEKYFEFLGIWEEIYNPAFDRDEYTNIMSEAGLNRFVMSVKQWSNRTKSKGIVAKAGRYGGTYRERKHFKIA